MNVWEAISAHACKSKTNGVWRFAPCSDCRVYGTWKRDRDRILVLLAAAAFCRVVIRRVWIFAQELLFIWQQ